MKLLKFCTLITLALLCLPGLAFAQRYNSIGIGGSRPYGLYGPYITRPYSASATLRGIYAPRITRPYPYSSSLYYQYAFPSYKYGGGYRAGYSQYSPYRNYYWNNPTYGYRRQVRSKITNFKNDPSQTNIRSSFYPNTGKTEELLPAPAKTEARIEIRVPVSDARIWFGNKKTSQQGLVRDFISPPLEPGKKYRYQLRAVWREQGVEVERNRAIEVQAGDFIQITLGNSTGVTTPK